MQTSKHKIILDRDKRYDGVFYFAVKTTGIFCRPSCPASRPLEKNVEYYDTVADAIRQGFRACKRCKPEQSLDQPVTLAIDALDDTTVADAALSLGMSGRHLRRLTKHQLGLTPHEITQSKRIMTAKNLLSGTNLSIIDIAFSACYNSLRQFNDAFKQNTSETPSHYRKAHANEAQGGAIDITLRLPYKKPLEWEPLKKALLAHMIPGLENVDEEKQTLERLIKTKHGYARITLDLQPPENTVNVRLRAPAIENTGEVVATIKRVLDLDCDPKRVQEAFSHDELIAPLVKNHPGLRVCGMFEPYELLINTIIGQQVSIAAARTFSSRLVRAYGKKVGDLYTYPSAKTLANADPMEIYEQTKLNHKKIATIQAACQLLDDGFDLAMITRSEAARQQLLSVKGIGPWTVEYVALRGYGDSDGFPADDLFIKRALNAKTGKEAEHAAEKWRPYRGYATMHLWTKGTYE